MTKALTPKKAGKVPKDTAPKPPDDKNGPRIVSIGKRSIPEMKEIGGSGFQVWDDQLLHRTYLTFPARRMAGDDEDKTEKRNAAVAGLGLRAFRPTDEIEAMLAAQAVMLHAMAMECGRKAVIPEQHPDVASKLRKDACNAARSMVEMTEALQRRRGKGSKQTVRVERVNVAPGGQVAVGNFTRSGALPQPEQQIAIASPSVEPVSVDLGEGEAE